MPLPEKWTGLFWGPESNGDLLYDITPEQLCALGAERGDALIIDTGDGKDKLTDAEIDALFVVKK